MNTGSRFFTLFLLAFISFRSIAQTGAMQYFDGNDRVVNIDKAVYYRKISKPDTGAIYLGVEYWMDGHIKMVGQSLDSEFLSKIGNFTYYYKNGNKSGEGQYYSDPNQQAYSFRNKKWETWYPDGKPKEEWVYKISDNFNEYVSYLLNFWDTTGAQVVVRGQGTYWYADWTSTKDSLQKINFRGSITNGRYDGVWKGFYTNGREYAEDTYKDGKLIRGKSFDGGGNAYSYDSLEVAARFPGGDGGLRLFLKQNIQAVMIGNRDNEYQYRIPVIVRAFVGSNGFIGNVKIIRGVNKPMDEEAIRVTKTLPRIQPAAYRGQPVDSYIILPITFIN